MTPLALACKYGFEDIALTLIEKIDIDALYNQKAQYSPIRIEFLLYYNKTKSCTLEP